MQGLERAAAGVVFLLEEICQSQERMNRKRISFRVVFL